MGTPQTRWRESTQSGRLAIIAEMRDRAQSEAARVTEQAQRQLEAERQQALTQLHREVGRLAVDLAGRVVGESLTDEERQQRVVDRFLADLERGDVEREQANQAAAYEAAGRTGSTALGGGTA